MPQLRKRKPTVKTVSDNIGKKERKQSPAVLCRSKKKDSEASISSKNKVKEPKRSSLLKRNKNDMSSDEESPRDNGFQKKKVSKASSSPRKDPKLSNAKVVLNSLHIREENSYSDNVLFHNSVDSGISSESSVDLSEIESEYNSFENKNVSEAFSSPRKDPKLGNANKKLEEILVNESLPTTIQGFKNHPLYVLKRHLLKYEAIYPPDAPPVGVFRSEPVYARDCVHLLHTREKWLEEARVVRVGEEPYKIVKARPIWDKIAHVIRTDLPPAGIFGLWQTEPDIESEYNSFEKKNVSEAFSSPRKDPNLGKANKKLEEMLVNKPFPTTIQGFKNHPLYVLKRHLLKYEAIYPPDAPPVGFIRSEPVYARDCVHQLHTRKKWLEEARVVRVGEEPYKIVKARPIWDKIARIIRTDLPPAGIFGLWQTEPYEPPIAVNGKVPRNEYGNVELFKPSMLPRGTVHLQLPGVNRIAKKLGIDCSPAFVGFERNRGFAKPAFDGFVICEEFKDTILAAWEKEQVNARYREEEGEIEKKSKRTIKKESVTYTRVPKVKKVLSAYEQMIQKNREEKMAFLQSINIEEAKIDLAKTVEKKKIRMYVKRKFKEPTSPPVVRKSRRLTNISVDLSEDALYFNALKVAEESVKEKEKREMY